MKSLLILVLALALSGSAFFTRPTEADFHDYVAKELYPPGGNLIDQFTRDAKVKSFLENAHYKDRYLWVEVERDGKIAYTGAFSHWFDRGNLTKKSAVRSGEVPGVVAYVQ